MEQLLAIEVFKDSCSCCLRLVQPPTRLITKITSVLQEIFMDLFNEDLIKGLICDNCNLQLQNFHKFKNEILEIRQFYVKIKDEEVVTNPEETELKSTGNEKVKDTKLNKLLRLYNVQFVSDDSARTTKSPKVICPICDKVLTATAFPYHFKTAHEGVRRECNFLCEICSKKYVSYAELVIHKRRHTKEKPFQCDHCLRAFFSCKKNLIHHLKVKHLSKSYRSLIVECNVCLKKLRSENLQRHKIKNHLNGTDGEIKVNPETDHFHCEACNGQFRTKRALNSHFCATANDGPSQNECLICKTSFRSRLEVINHIQGVHSIRLDDAKWKCLVCNSIQANKIVLHIESVHAVLGSMCPYCSKELKNRRCLKNHIYVVHQNGSELRKQKRRNTKLMKS